MSEIIDAACYIVVVGGIFLFILSLRKPKRHQWYEVNSSDIANAERKRGINWRK